MSSLRSKKEDEKDLKSYVSTMQVSSAHVFLPIHSTIRLIKNEGLCTKGAVGHGIAYSALEQAVGPAVLVQVKSESQSGKCRSLA